MDLEHRLTIAKEQLEKTALDKVNGTLTTIPLPLYPPSLSALPLSLSPPLPLSPCLNMQTSLLKLMLFLIFSWGVGRIKTLNKINITIVFRPVAGIAIKMCFSLLVFIQDSDWCANKDIRPRSIHIKYAMAKYCIYRELFTLNYLGTLTVPSMARITVQVSRLFTIL